MFKKSLSVVLAILMVFSGFSVSAFANTEETPVTPEPVTYTAQNGSRVKTDIVLLSTVKNELTVIHPGDAVKFVDARGNYVDRPLVVTYYSDVDALLKNSVKNTAFLESRFDLHGNNLYKDVTAASASKALFFQDNLAVGTTNNTLYTIKGLGELSTSYCDAGEFIAEQEIDFSFDSNRGKFIGWVAQTATASTSGNTIVLYALWEKDARTGCTIKCVDPDNNEIGTSAIRYGYVGEEITVSPSEITGYTPVLESQKITLDENPENNIVTFEHNVLNIQYIVRCVDKASGTVLNEETLEAQEGSVSVTPQDIEGYSLPVNEGTKTITLSRHDAETQVVEFNYDPILVEEEDDFITKLKRLIIRAIINLLCEIDAVNEALTEELFLGMTVNDLLNMLVEVGFATLLVRLLPAVKELIPFEMLWEEMGI